MTAAAEMKPDNALDVSDSFFQGPQVWEGLPLIGIGVLNLWSSFLVLELYSLITVEMLNVGCIVTVAVSVHRTAPLLKSADRQ